MESVEALVVGAGVVGLAVARAIARSGKEVWVVDSESAFGTHTSSRNSEVIHAGLYYAPGSLKAKLCVAGRQQLYDYCASRGVQHRQCGKLIVATEPDQRSALERIAARADAAGAGQLKWLTGEQVRSFEPALRAEEALWSPATGIIDSHGLMLSYLGEVEDHGGSIVYQASFRRATPLPGGGFEVDVEGSDGIARFKCQWLVNATGLFASDTARRVEGLADQWVPQTRFAKGNYFSLTGRAPFSRLIYPVPSEAGLGVHLTLDLSGRARFGPDVEWVSRIDYEVSAERESVFYEEIRAYWPGLPPGSLVADYCGIRPKLVGEGAAAADFRIDGPGDHGLDGLVNLFGIESPGLTASLALADAVLVRLRG